MENVEIARILDELGDLLEIRGENPFRVRAYRNAARTVRSHSTPLRKLVEEGEDLTALAGIGKEMAAHIRELVETGKLGRHEEALRSIPPELLEFVRIPGLGPKRAKQLWEELGITTVAALQEACEQGRLSQLKGFGEKIQKNILEGIESYRSQQGRFKLSDADLYVVPLKEYMEKAPGVERVEVAGSYRRRKETVGDIDILAVARKAVPVMEHFISYPGVAKVQSSGETRGTVFLGSGLQVDLRILPRESFGAALAYFTGSKEHNIRIRRLAMDRGLRVSEYGVFRVGRKKEAEAGRARKGGKEETDLGPFDGPFVAGREERDVYKSVGLPWIPPELREDRGEIEAAQQNALPCLIELRDIRGDLQMHSNWSDGQSTIEEMAAACKARNYEYLAITDHSKAVSVAGGLDAERLRKQWREIEKVAERLEGIRILKGMEIDILADGTLDLEDALLEKLDIVLVAVHSKFNLPPAKQTERILKALQHPRVQILGHPTGRILNRRGPIAFDLDEVLSCAAELGVAMELNAHPDRLDLMDLHLMEARRRGIKVVINTDAHRIEDLDLMRYGVEQARRGWLGKEHVLNSLPFGEFMKALRR